MKWLVSEDKVGFYFLLKFKGNNDTCRETGKGTKSRLKITETREISLLIPITCPKIYKFSQGLI